MNSMQSIFDVKECLMVIGCLILRTVSFLLEIFYNATEMLIQAFSRK